MKRAWFRSCICLAGLGAATLSACGDDGTGVVFEVIEETTFHPSLGVDLAAMSRSDDGVYLQEVTPGVGDRVLLGDHVYLQYVLHLTNGDSIGAGPLDFLAGPDPVTGLNPVVDGFLLSVLGMRPGGLRKAVVPPSLGYGALGQPQGGIPGGAVLVFDIQLDSVAVAAP